MLLTSYQGLVMRLHFVQNLEHQTGTYLMSQSSFHAAVW